MVLTKSELQTSLEKEGRILLHLAGKVDAAHVDYRPTPKQRSTIELLRYLSMMGPMLVEATKSGGFDPVAWGKAEEAAGRLNLDGVVSAIAAQPGKYAALLADMSDADFRKPVTMFGNDTTVGAFMVNGVIASCAAYRTQLFCYLKSCGRVELGTTNLWGGVDAPVAAA